MSTGTFRNYLVSYSLADVGNTLLAVHRCFDDGYIIEIFEFLFTTNAFDFEIFGTKQSQDMPLHHIFLKSDIIQCSTESHSVGCACCVCR